MREEFFINELVESRKVEMRSALKWSLALAIGFVLVTLDILNQGLLAYIVFRYTKRAPFEGLKLYWLAALLTIGVGLASLLRNTHWVSDLIGGLFLGGAILVLVVAVDRFIPSRRQPT